MLKSLSLKNFRTHKKTKLDFCSGVNGIIGIGSSGKTNILRALKLLYTNRPLGTGVISRFVMKIRQKTTIESQWSNAGKITYVKTGDPKNSYYQINDEKPYRKFGQNPPEQITDAINISDINFANQFDGPFLIFSGPGEISKTINKITGADEFDDWIKEVNERIKKIKFKTEDADYRIEKYRLDKENLDDLPRTKRWVDKAIKASLELHYARSEFDEITDLYNTRIGLMAKANLHKRIANLKIHVVRAKKIRRKMDRYDETIELLETLIQKRKAYEKTLKRHKKLAKRFTRELMKKRQCPTCLSPIKQSTIQRLKREIHIAK